MSKTNNTQIDHDENVVYSIEQSLLSILIIIISGHVYL